MNFTQYEFKIDNNDIVICFGIDKKEVAKNKHAKNCFKIVNDYKKMLLNDSDNLNIELLKKLCINNINFKESINAYYS